MFEVEELVKVTCYLKWVHLHLNGKTQFILDRMLKKYNVLIFKTFSICSNFLVH